MQNWQETERKLKDMLGANRFENCYTNANRRLGHRGISDPSREDVVKEILAHFKMIKEGEDWSDPDD